MRRAGRPARLRPVGRRRPVDQPDAGPAARRVRASRAGAGGLGRRRRPVPRLRLPTAPQPGEAEVPGRRLGHRAVPRGPGARVPGRERARRRPAAAGTCARVTGPHRRAPPARRACTTSALPRTPAARPARSSGRWPTWPRPMVLAGSAPPSSRSCSSWTCPSGRCRSWWPSCESVDLTASPSVFRRGTMACTGIEFCKLAIVETKGRARDLYTELDRRLPGFDTPITINVNGCPNSCARFQLADIGLKGSIVDGAGRLPGAPGRVTRHRPWLRAQTARPQGDCRRPARLRDRLLRNYQADRASGEQFASWVRRADAELLT